MQNLTPEGLRAIAEAAERHGVGRDAAIALIGALIDGNGRQAQFNHPDLGGMGQWSEGGMIMIGDMFNQSLKYRVDALCNELAGLLKSQPTLAGEPATPSQAQGQSGVSLFVRGSGSGGQWWPADLGAAASTGAQNDLRYAFFPDKRRLAIEQGGRLSIYDTGEQRISGFSQQQGGDRSVTFTSQFGLVRVDDLRRVDPRGGEARDSAQPQTRDAVAPAAPPHMRETAAPAATPTAPRSAPQAADDILKTIERLAELRRKDILTEDEFSAKKAELLARL
jgi:hypothetical protein